MPHHRPTTRRTCSLALLLLGGALHAQSLDWAIGLGGPNTDQGQDVAVAPDGSIYTTGYYYDQIDLDPSTASYFFFAPTNAADGFFSKYDAQGHFIWARRLSGPDIVYPHSIAVDAAGAVYVAGSFQGTIDLDPSSGADLHTATGSYDGFLAKYDANGNLLWGHQLGSYSYDWINQVAVDPAGQVYVTGYFTGLVDFDPGPGTTNVQGHGMADIFLAKYAPDGTLGWAIGMGGAHNEEGRSLAFDAAANIHLCGYFGDGADFDPGPGTLILNTQNKDTFLAVYDSTGALIRANDLGGGTIAGSNCEAMDVAVDATGSAAITGIFWGWIDMDPGPGTTAMTPIGTGDIFVARYDPTGALLWARQYGGTEEGIGNSVALDSSGNVYTTGYFRATVDFDPGAGVAPLNATVGRDIFVASLNAAGDHRWAFKVGGTGIEEVGYALATTNDNTLLLAGSFGDAACVDPALLADSLQTHGGMDAFVARYALDDVTTGIAPVESADAVLLYPNPLHTQGEVRFTNPAHLPAYLQLYDAQGRLVLRTAPTTSDRIVLDRGALAPGLYQVQLVSGDAVRDAGRWVVE